MNASEIAIKWSGQGTPQTILKKMQQGPNILCMRKENAFKFLSNLIASCLSSAIFKKNLQQIIEFGTATTYPYFKSWTWNSILSQLAAQSTPKQQAKVLCLVSWPWLTLPHATFLKPSPKCRVFWENKWKHHGNRILSELIIMFAIFYWKWNICLKPSSHPPQHDATLNSHQHSSRRGTCIGGNIGPFTQSVKVINLPATSMKLAGRWCWLAT